MAFCLLPHKKYKGAEKMKKKLLGVISTITCLAFIASPMCCGAVGELEALEILAETIYQQTLSGDSIENNPYTVTVLNETEFT